MCAKYLMKRVSARTTRQWRQSHGGADLLPVNILLASEIH